MIQSTIQLSGVKMPRTVSASIAKNQLGALIQWSLRNQDEVIIESYGNPKAVIMPFDEYQSIQALRDQKRREKALSQMQKLRDTVQARNQDLTEEEADGLTDQFTREVVEEMVKEGKVKFQNS